MDKLIILKNMIEDSPTNANVWYLLGIEYRELEMYSESLSAFSEALKYCDSSMREKIFEELPKLTEKARGNTSYIIDKADDIMDIEGTEPDNNFNNVPISDDDQGNGAKLKVIDFKNESKRISKEITRKENIVTFADVGGLENLKETIRMKIIKPFSQPGLFEKYKKKVGGGILLFGPPGCGKTFIAKATAGECNAKFIPVHITDILDPYIGVSEQNVRSIFSNARAKKPCILFFDEIDTLGYNRSKMHSDTMRSVVDQFLAEIEGIESNTEHLLIIGATNMPWDIDPALKRPGRFDRSIFVPPPDKNARIEIFKLKVAGRPIGSIDFQWLAERTDLYSGADIEYLVETATENVLAEIMKSGIERTIGMKDMEKALEMVRPSTIEWMRTIKNYVTYANQTGLYDDVDEYLNRYKKLIQ